MGITPAMIATMAAAQGLSALGQNVGSFMSLAPSETVNKRIDELKRAQEADALGLTGDQKSAYMAAFTAPAKALAAQQLQQSQSLTSMGQDSGKALQAMRTQEEQAQRAVSEAQMQVEMANQQLAMQQAEELRSLQLAEEQRKQARKAALITGATEAASSAASAYGQAKMLSQMTGGDMSIQNAAALGKMYGYNLPTYSPSFGANPYMYSNPYANYGQMIVPQVPMQTPTGGPQ